MRRELKNSERRAVWETLLARSKNCVLQHGQHSRIADEVGLQRKVVERIWSHGRETMGARVAALIKSRSSQRGRKKKDRAVYCAQIRAIPVCERTNQARLEIAAATSRYIIQQLAKEGFIAHALHQTRHLLTGKHLIERLKFCVRHVVRFPFGVCRFEETYDIVHIDEKWFYIKKVGDKIYIVTEKDGKPAEMPPEQHIQSKTFIIKVMFLVAVARPRGDWGGKIGIWPVTEPSVTKRTSVNRPAGITIDVPVTIDRPKARQMLVNDVIPAIKASWPRDQQHMAIRIQQDNAKPHVLEEDEEVLAAGRSDGWNITLATKKSWRCQPAQSPDFNFLDLGFFHCIQSLQNQTRPGNIAELVAEVKRAFEATPREALEKTF